MTSEENNNQTLDFLEEHNYFGYPKEKVKYFKKSVFSHADGATDTLADFFM